MGNQPCSAGEDENPVEQFRVQSFLYFPVREFSVVLERVQKNCRGSSVHVQNQVRTLGERNFLDRKRVVQVLVLPYVFLRPLAKAFDAHVGIVLAFHPVAYSRNEHAFLFHFLDEIHRVFFLQDAVPPVFRSVAHRTSEPRAYGEQAACDSRRQVSARASRNDCVVRSAGVRAVVGHEHENQVDCFNRFFREFLVKPQSRYDAGERLFRFDKLAYRASSENRFSVARCRQVRNDRRHSSHQALPFGVREIQGQRRMVLRFPCFRSPFLQKFLVNAGDFFSQFVESERNACACLFERRVFGLRRGFLRSASRSRVAELHFALELRRNRSDGPRDYGLGDFLFLHEFCYSYFLFPADFSEQNDEFHGIVFLHSQRVVGHGRQGE